MRWVPILISVALVTTVVAASAPAAARPCIDVDIETNPVLPREEFGEVRVCDDDRDGGIESVHVQTRPVYTESTASVDRDQWVSNGRQTETLQANLVFYAGIPLDPTVTAGFEAKDRGDDESFDRVTHEGAASLNTPGENPEHRHFIGVWDLDQDGTPETWGLLVCTVEVGCGAPGLHTVPDVDPKVPDLAFHIDGVGWVP